MVERFDELRDETVVVRGGLMSIPSLRSSLLDGFAAEDTWNLSFWGENEMDVDGVTREGRIPHSLIRTSVIGELRALGLDPKRSEPWPHLTVRFETEPADEELEELVAAFGEPFPNPNPAG